jgi:hypothetical protein
MLAVLDDLQVRANAQLGFDETPYERRKRIIGQSLYGVDVMDWAVHVAELRLWLQLVVETPLQPAELKFRPLLPNLSFKVRPGDSLVQEVGGINLALRHGSRLIPSTLKGRITQLKGEKLKFYNNVRPRTYLTEEQLQQAELQLFRDILRARAKAIDERLKEIADALRPQVNLFGEIQDTQMRLDRVTLERERDHLQTEREQVARARPALTTVGSVPFVWDIAFVEIFEGDKGGFDIVLGNPPYVRQERIAPPDQREDDYDPDEWRGVKKEYKDKLQRSVAVAYPRYFGYKPTSGKFRKLDGKSDLYVYFYLHGLSLLNENGSFCFITSNSWLDVGYGKDLQEFLLKHSQAKMILDNEARRTFAQADVNTIIALLGPPDDQRPAGLDRTARFVMFKVPFEEVLSPVVFQEIEEATDRVVRPEFRVIARKQRDLHEEGLTVEEKDKVRKAAARYQSNKWGGKYLRAPEIFFTILEKGKGRLVRLGDIAEVRRGFTTGANAFFYLNEERVAEWEIEKEFLKPVIKTPRDYYSIIVPSRRGEYLLWCNRDKRALKGTNVLEYIKWGETHGFDERPSCRGRRPWYALNGPTTPTMLWPSTFFERYICYECPRGFVADKVFYAITARHLPTTTKAFLNSSVVALFMEVEGYQLNHGGIFNTTEWLKRLPVLAGSRPGIEEAYRALSRRDILLIADEVKEPDRRALDAAVLGVLGLPASLLDNLYDEVCQRVHGRILKARRKPTERGRTGS